MNEKSILLFEGLAYIDKSDIPTPIQTKIEAFEKKRSYGDECTNEFIEVVYIALKDLDWFKRNVRYLSSEAQEIKYQFSIGDEDENENAFITITSLLEKCSALYANQIEQNKRDESLLDKMQNDSYCRLQQAIQENLKNTLFNIHILGISGLAAVLIIAAALAIAITLPASIPAISILAVTSGLLVGIGFFAYYKVKQHTSLLSSSIEKTTHITEQVIAQLEKQIGEFHNKIDDKIHNELTGDSTAKL